MNERTQLLECLRAELVGPSRPLSEPDTVAFVGRDFHDPAPQRRGPIEARS